MLHLLFVIEFLTNGLRLLYTTWSLDVAIFLFTQCDHIYERIKINTQVYILSLSKIFFFHVRGYLNIIQFAKAHRELTFTARYAKHFVYYFLNFI